MLLQKIKNLTPPCWFLIIFLAYLNLFLLGCDRISEKHGTLIEARKMGAFERGWLPDILPDSTFDIKMNNNLDTNESEGEFKFKPQDADAFTKKLEKLHDFSKNDSSEYLLSEYSYSRSKTTGQFQCQITLGHCKYKLKP